MNKRITPTLLLLVLILLGCTEQGTEQFAELATEQQLAQTDQAESPELTERKVIKEGFIDFATDDLAATRSVILAAVRDHGGYVAADRQDRSPGHVSHTLEVRVPAADFDLFLAEATRGVERFDGREIRVRDVTEEYLDVEARLATKKALEERYLNLLQRAATVTEILEIEKQIGELRGDIESIEGRLNYLQDRVALSSLTLTFYERVPVDNAFAGRFRDGFRSGWENLIWFFVGLTHLWPFLLIATVLLLAWRTYRR